MQHSQIAIQQVQAEARPAPLPLRDDTILGVCEALGSDFGFHPNWLRIALATGLLWNPTAIFGIYFGLGVIVVASRLLFPPRKAVPVAASTPVLAAAGCPAVEADPERELVAA